VRLFTRHGTDFTARYPKIAAAVESLPVRSKPRECIRQIHPDHPANLIGIVYRPNDPFPRLRNRISALRIEIRASKFIKPLLSVIKVNTRGTKCASIRPKLKQTLGRLVVITRSCRHRQSHCVVSAPSVGDLAGQRNGIHQLTARLEPLQSKDRQQFISSPIP
jgi:hypothetical protein